jgi:hypothetical protein
VSIRSIFNSSSSIIRCKWSTGLHPCH